MNRLYDKKTLPRTLFLIAAIVIVSYFLPRRDKFEYEYRLGRPWTYSLLTAPFDIPINIDSVSARHIRDSIEGSFANIYFRNSQIASEMQKKFNVSLASNSIPPLLRSQLSSAMNKIYSRGIIDSDAYSRIAKGEMPQIKVIEGNITSNINTSRILSIKLAYKYIDSTAIAFTGNSQIIQQLHLSEYLTPNIRVDSVTTGKLKNEELRKALAPIGLLQKGERIIDRGDIVDARTFTILKTYQQMRDEQSGSHQHSYYPIIGQVMFVTIIFISLYCFLAYFRWKIYGNTRSMAFIMSLITIFTVLAFIYSRHAPNSFMVVPFATIPILITIFFDSRTALYAHLSVVFLSALLANSQLDFILMHFIAGMTAIISIKELSKRSQLLNCAVFIFIAYAITYISLHLIREGNVTNISYQMFGYFGVNAILLFFNYILIFIIEKVFGFTSTVTLVELSDVSNPLLRELSEECPGTFQHSLQVANLAAEAARKIGANTQLARTGALYHDIGKIDNPAFFTENQHGVNPHGPISPEQSARIVINHVRDGVKRAERAKLPKVVIDFITQHHGLGKAKYFYNTACNNCPDGGDIDPAKFTYPGPNPNTKETSIMMMADATEAASRSLTDHSMESISNLVNKIVDSQIMDGLLNDSPLSFKDIRIIKQTFIERLSIIYHTRIQYPELKK